MSINLTVKESLDGWEIIDKKRSVRVFFAKNKYNLCYALKGRTEKQVIEEYNSFLNSQNIPLDKAAWFDPEPKDETIQKIEYPINDYDTFEYALKSRTNSSIEVFKNVIWTSQKNLTLGIQTADCVPLVFISDDKVCMCHLYWWHTFNGFLQKVIDNLKENNFKNFEAVIGPFYKQPMTRNIFDIGLKTFSIADELLPILINNNIPFLDIDIDTSEHPDLWSYVTSKGNNGNQAAIITMY